MKKTILILMLLLCIGIVNAEKAEMNYTISITTTHEVNETGRFKLMVDGNDWGSGWCDGEDHISPVVSVIREVDCGEREIGTIDTLSDHMSTFVDQFNETRITFLDLSGSCLTQLKNCEISNEHKGELLKDCNGTESDWYEVYRETQANLNTCTSKSCFDQAYVDQLKDDAKGRRAWDIGVTAAIVGLIAYILYFRKGLAKNPYQEV